MRQFKDKLSASCGKSELQALLEANNQHVPRGISEIQVLLTGSHCSELFQDRCAEGMYFGALKPCTMCSHNYWEYQADGLFSRILLSPT